LSSVRKQLATVVVVSTAAIGVYALGPAGASSADCSGGTGGTTVCSSSSGHYVNPFHRRKWLSGRIDMGVDWMPKRRHAVVAIGDAKIKGSDSHSGWPGGHYIYYKLLNGDHAGNFVFVAETLRHLAPAGTRVQAGQRIATALPRATGLEIGWANRSGEPRAAPCYSEGDRTNSGKQMARFLRHLGARITDRPGPGPDEPSGKRC
jgi:hypothetical protein